MRIKNAELYVQKDHEGRLPLLLCHKTPRGRPTLLRVLQHESHTMGMLNEVSD